VAREPREEDELEPSERPTPVWPGRRHEQEPKYDRAFDLALRLLSGETLELVDDVGRLWIATACSLSRSRTGEPVVEGSAADVAIAVLDRHLCAGPTRKA
jgi:hypothetical protein